MVDKQQTRTVEAAAAPAEGDERAAMAKMYEETLKDFVEGSIIPGKVLEVRGNEVLVDIGYKSEGVIPANEFPDIASVKPGDIFNVLLEGIEDDEGMVMLSKAKAEQQERWNNVVATYKEGSIVEGEVRARVKGGMIVDVGGIESFLPGSQIDVAPVHDPDALVGKRLEFKIIRSTTTAATSSCPGASCSKSGGATASASCWPRSRSGRSAAAWPRTSPTSACSWTWTAWTGCSTSPT